jgi:uncharacterized protein (DUF1330 family)
VVVDVVVKDAVRYDDHRNARWRRSSPMAEHFLRGGKVETLEGRGSRSGLSSSSFLMLSQRAWWNSEEFAEPKAIRQSASHTEMILAEGI